MKNLIFTILFALPIGGCQTDTSAFEGELVYTVESYTKDWQLSSEMGTEPYIENDVWGNTYTMLVKEGDCLSAYADLPNDDPYVYLFLAESKTSYLNLQLSAAKSDVDAWDHSNWQACTDVSDFKHTLSDSLHTITVSLLRRGENDHRTDYKFTFIAGELSLDKKHFVDNYFSYSNFIPPFPDVQAFSSIEVITTTIYHEKGESSVDKKVFTLKEVRPFQVPDTTFLIDPSIKVNVSRCEQ